jgi:2'-5' RNA ligase
MDSTMKRLFVGIMMPPSIIEEAQRVQQIIKDKNFFEGTYDNVRQLHLTLNFIGDVSSAASEAIKEALRSVYAHPMQGTLGPLNIFTTGATIKVLYLNFYCPALMLLVEQINQALLPWKNPESRPFVPHLTLARVQHVPDKEIFFQTIHLVEVEHVICPLNAFMLIESVPSAQGHHYKTVETYQLRSRA